MLELDTLLRSESQQENNKPSTMQNEEANNQNLLEILACDKTLQDFENYLINKGFQDMINCITSKEEIVACGTIINEKEQFNYFFKYFGLDISTDDEKLTFINNLKHSLATLNNNNDIEKNHTLLSIIAVALQNCKLRTAFAPEDPGLKFSKNLLSLLSQAQYFLRFAENCKTSFSTMNIFDNDNKTKKINIIDTNNFLYVNPNIMPLNTTQTTKENCKQHFYKIATTILEKSQQQMTPQKKQQVINIIPTSTHWGYQQNPYIIKQYNEVSEKDKNIEYRILFDINKEDTNKKPYYDKETKKEINEIINNNNKIQLYDHKQKQETEFPENNEEIIVNYLNSGDHLVFPPNEGYTEFNNDGTQHSITHPISTDVAMVRTDFFKHLGADGKINKFGIFQFNNKKAPKENFKSLNMPNTFMFKQQKVDAKKFMKELKILPISTQHNKMQSYQQVEPQNTNRCCNCLTHVFPCLKNFV